MIGTGVFSTRNPLSSQLILMMLTRTYIAGSILKAVGSVGLSLIFWVIGFFFAGGAGSRVSGRTN